MIRSQAALGMALALAGCAAQPAPAPLAAMGPAPAPAESPATIPSSMQWLYGSGEGGAAGIQAYHAMREHVLSAVRKRPADSVVLADGSTLDAPRFVPCGARPLAVVLDVDETALLNLGYEYDDSSKARRYDSDRFGRWEQSGIDKVLPVPGAVTALRAMRDAGVTVIFNTNRSAENARFSEKTIALTGLGPARHGETLFLKGDAGGASGKDGRRALIAQRYCVVAMAGDQFGDFSDLLNAKTLSIQDRRRAATGGIFASLWGNGWFLLPNPVYGPGVRGGFDDVFPADKRWTDPAGGSQ